MSETPRPWPEADLEAVPHCQACGSVELHEAVPPAWREFLILSVRK